MTTLKRVKACFMLTVHSHDSLPHLSTPRSFLQISLLLSANQVLLYPARTWRNLGLMHFAISLDILARKGQDRQ